MSKASIFILFIFTLIFPQITLGENSTQLRATLNKLSDYFNERPNSVIEYSEQAQRSFEKMVEEVGASSKLSNELKSNIAYVVDLALNGNRSLSVSQNSDELYKLTLKVPEIAPVLLTAAHQAIADYRAALNGLNQRRRSGKRGANVLPYVRRLNGATSELQASAKLMRRLDLMTLDYGRELENIDSLKNDPEMKSVLKKWQPPTKRIPRINLEPPKHDWDGEAKQALKKIKEITEAIEANWYNGLSTYPEEQFKQLANAVAQMKRVPKDLESEICSVLRAAFLSDSFHFKIGRNEKSLLSLSIKLPSLEKELVVIAENRLQELESQMEMVAEERSERGREGRRSRRPYNPENEQPGWEARDAVALVGKVNRDSKVYSQLVSNLIRLNEDFSSHVTKPKFCHKPLKKVASANQD